MKKSLIILLVAVIFLGGCSSFCFGNRDKEKKERNKSKPETIAEIKLERQEIVEFRKRTAPDYEEIVALNRSFISETAIAETIFTTKEWLVIQPNLKQFTFKEVRKLINSQADAQKYVNLLLSLLTDEKNYQAVVLETNEDAPYYPGSYLFITRKEIENCQDERDLAEILSFRLIRNDYLNKNIDYNLFDKHKSEESLRDIIQKDKSKWDEYALNSANNLQEEISDNIAVMMIRAGFEPSFPHKRAINIKYISPLMRHKKVFD